MIFVDTWFWYARFVVDDADHASATSWLKSISEPLVTSDYCIDETLTLIAARNRPELAIVAGRHLFGGTMAELRFVSSQQIHRAWILFQQRAAAGWSFTDCTSKIVIDDLGIGAAASFDRHFKQFGVQILPLP
jgi:predicted nucleic acid-binding protein